MSTKLEMMQLVLLRESLRKQLDEFELLKSIYSMPGEFQSDNSLLVDDIQDFLSGNRGNVHEKLDFRIKVQMTDKIKMELSVMLGQLYPSHELPIITIRTDSLTRQQETSVKRAIEKFIETEVDKSEPYIYQIISWLQDNIEEIVKVEEKVENEKIEEISATFERTWIWSHHIYSKIKRHDILKLCKNHQLSGFMWPGKPGVICLEGPSESVQEVVRTIKSWQWQKIKIVKVETSENGDEKDFYRFTGFEEILTGDNDDGEDVKMDTGRFFKYLNDHKSSNMKMEIFGFE
jgi:acylphosphatase